MHHAGAMIKRSPTTCMGAITLAVWYPFETQERRKVAKSYKYRLPPEIGSDVEGGSGAGVSDAGVSGAGVSGAAGVPDTSKVT